MQKPFAAALAGAAAIAAVAALGVTSPALAAPVTDTARVRLVGTAGNLSDEQTQTTLDGAAATQTVSSSSSTARGAADLATGIVRTSASTQAPSGDNADRERADSFAAWYDVLTFDNGGTVNLTYDLAFDGVLRRTAGSSALAKLNFTIYDITGIAQIFGTDGELTGDVVSSQVADADYYAEAKDAFSDDELLYLPLFNDETLLSTEGVDADIEIDWSNSYGATLTSGRQYLFTMEGTSNGSTYLGTSALSDFYNTSSFSFVDLDGATFTSESGLFPGSTPAGDVPAPGGTGLLLLALAGLATRRGQRRRA